MEIPMLVTEQNPKALGKTVPQLDINGAKGPFAKTQFSMYTPEESRCVTSDKFMYHFTFAVLQKFNIYLWDLVWISHWFHWIDNYLWWIVDDDASENSRVQAK